MHKAHALKWTEYKKQVRVFTSCAVVVVITMQIIPICVRSQRDFFVDAAIYNKM